MGTRSRTFGSSLILLSIEVEGFISYTIPTTLTLKGGVVGVLGKNGSGKSTLTSKALTWCLYGKCAPERMGSGAKALRGKAVVKRSEKSARVKITLQRGSILYTVERTRSKKSADQVVVACDGEIINSGPEVIIGVNYDVFTRTVVRGQNDPWNFAEATDARKREIVDTISGANKLQDAHDLAKKKHKAASGELKEAQAVLVTLQGTQTLDVEELQERLTQLQTDLERVETLNTAAEQAVASLGPEPTLDLVPFQTPHSEARRVQTIASVELGQARAESGTYDRVKIGQPCPTCGGAVLPSLPVAKQQREAHHRLSKATRESAEADQWENECRVKLQDAQGWLTKQKAAWNVEVAKYQRQPVKHLQAHISDQKALIDQSARTAHDLARRIAYQSATIVQLEKETEIAGAWVNVLAPKGIRASMAESALASIAVESNRWISLLSGGSMSVDIESTRATASGRIREEITIKVAHDGEEQDLLQYSGGERARLNLAIDLGVASVFGGGGALALSLLVLDEQTFSGMDAEGKEAVIDALNSAGVHDVIVVDHSKAFTAALERTIMVKKVNGASVIEELE